MCNTLVWKISPNSKCNNWQSWSFSCMSHLNLLGILVLKKEVMTMNIIIVEVHVVRMLQLISQAWNMEQARTSTATGDNACLVYGLCPELKLLPFIAFHLFQHPFFISDWLNSVTFWCIINAKILRCISLFCSACKTWLNIIGVS